MLDGITTITVAGKDYPALADLNVYEWAQKTYGSVKAWLDKVAPDKGESDIGVLVNTLAAVINEGSAALSDEDGQKRPRIEASWLARRLRQKDLGDITAGLIQVLIDDGGAGQVQDGADQAVNTEENKEIKNSQIQLSQ